MSRKTCVTTARMGAIARDEPHPSPAIARMMGMMHETHGRGARLVVFPGLALTTFFRQPQHCGFIGETWERPA